MAISHKICNFGVSGRLVSFCQLGVVFSALRSCLRRLFCCRIVHSHLHRKDLFVLYFSRIYGLLGYLFVCLSASAPVSTSLSSCPSSALRLLSLNVPPYTHVLPVFFAIIVSITHSLIRISGQVSPTVYLL